MARTWKRTLALVLTLALVSSFTVTFAVAATPVGKVSDQNVAVDGKRVAAPAWNVSGNNYFRIRDVAYVLNGTGAQFSVSYNSAKGIIDLKTGSAYTPVGNELAAIPTSASKSQTTQKLSVDGKELSLTAYHIGGNYFFKLRDLGAALGFGVGFDTATRTIQITTSSLNNESIYQYILAEFKEIAKIPRGSSHTDAISDYLYKWGQDHGLTAQQDEVGNVRWDIPATTGYASAPLTILQAHMDMVTVSDDNRDMTTSPIVVVEDRDKGTLSSDGHTSLGSDDGIGVASAMYLATSKDYAHGPLRVIITINEEGGSPSGTGNMDHAWVTDAAYLVNIDSEDYATCTVSSCGFNSYSFAVPLKFETVSSGKIAYTIDLSGLRGGHSGVDIDKNRASAIKAVNYCMAWAKYNGVDIQLASFTGGTGGTAIPSLASATVVFSSQYESAFKNAMTETIQQFADQYDRTEAGYTFTYTKATTPTTALTRESSSTVIGLVSSVEEGVNTISQRYEGITESSFNLGTIKITPDLTSATINLSMRCSTRWPVMLANMQFQSIADAFGVKMTSRAMNPSDINVGWEEKEDDVLAQLYKKVFDQYTGDSCVITAVHGGLECADFADWNPNLQIISVGPTVESPHSVHEYVEIDTIPTTCGAIALLLADLATGAAAK